MRPKTDYMKVKAIRKLVHDLTECAEALSKGGANSKIQAETLTVVVDQINKILGPVDKLSR